MEQLKKGLDRILCMMCIFVFSGCLYITIEYCWRGYSHFSMFVLAGCMGILISILNNTVLTMDTDYVIQVLVATLFCTVGEWVAGLIVNSDYSIWDYRSLPFTLAFTNYQVNALFIIAWAVISALCIPLLDYLQYKMGLEEKPHYHSIFMKKRR